MPDEPNLFGVQPKAKKAKPAPVPGGVVHALIGAYVRLFGQRFRGEKPHIAPADGKALKQLVVEHGSAKVEQRLPMYMTLDDVYIAEAGYPLRLMPSAWNKLTALLHQQERASRQDTSAQRTQDYLKKLRGSAHG